jgi:hypothetical protein
MYGLLRGVIFEIPLLSSYALSPTMLPPEFTNAGEKQHQTAVGRLGAKQEVL